MTSFTNSPGLSLNATCLPEVRVKLICVKRNPPKARLGSEAGRFPVVKERTLETERSNHERLTL